jgi:hypothetical protein
VSTITLARVERNNFQEENSKLLKENVILKDAKTAKATVEILEHQTSSAILFQEVKCKLLREGAFHIISAIASDDDARIHICYERPRMLSGLYRWYIQIEEPCDHLWVGIVDLSVLSGDLEFAYSADGCAYRRDASTGSLMKLRSDLPKYHKGSQVNFIFGMGEVKQYLQASVDGGSYQTLWYGSDLKTNDGYLPAVRPQKPGKVRVSLGGWNNSE